MASPNVEIVRAAIEARNRGDMDAALRDTAPDFVFDFSRAVGPNRGVFALSELREFWDGFAEPWESIRWQAQEFIETGDHVITPTTLYVVGREGIELQARAAWIWTFRDRKIARLTFYQERHEALKAAGLWGQPLSQENVEVVRAAIEAGNRGDFDAVFKHAAPNFEWDNSHALGADNRGVFSVEEARQFLAGVREVWESTWVEIEDLIPVGDHVVVPHTTHVRGRDGIEAQARTTWVFTIRDRQIERVCLYQDQQDALEAVRLADRPESDGDRKSPRGPLPRR